MTPNYGPNARSEDVVPDWFLGGDRRRRLLAALAISPERENWTVDELVEEVRCGPATVYEVLRILRPLELIERLPGGRYRFVADARLARAVRELLLALRPFSSTPTPRPPRGKRRS